MPTAIPASRTRRGPSGIPSATPTHTAASTATIASTTLANSAYWQNRVHEPGARCRHSRPPRALRGSCGGSERVATERAPVGVADLRAVPAVGAERVFGAGHQPMLAGVPTAPQCPERLRVPELPDPTGESRPTVPHLHLRGVSTRLPRSEEGSTACRFCSVLILATCKDSLATGTRASGTRCPRSRDSGRRYAFRAKEESDESGAPDGEHHDVSRGS